MKKLEKEDAKCFVTRGRKGGSVSYVTKNVARHFITNQFDSSCRRNGVKLVSAGVKVFTVKNATKMYNISDTGERICNPRHTRVLQVGLDVLLPLLTRRVCEMSMKEMSTLLAKELGKPFDTPGLLSSERVEALKDFPNGCLVIRMNEKDMKEHVIPKFPQVDSLAICVFKGDKTMNLMITKETQKNITHFLKDCLSDDADPTFPGLQQALKEQDELEKEAAFTKEEEEKMKKEDTVASAKTQEQNGSVRDQMVVTDGVEEKKVEVAVEETKEIAPVTSSSADTPSIVTAAASTTSEVVVAASKEEVQEVDKEEEKKKNLSAE